MSPKGKRNPGTAFLSRTLISVEKTAAEIQELLGRAGARRTMMEYEDGQVAAISFSLVASGQDGNREILFRLPVRWEKYLAVMQRIQKKRNSVDPQQAKRTAWRVAKAWIEAQLAMVKSEMVVFPEAMLAYLVQHPDGLTLFERLESSGFKLLEHHEKNP